MADLDTLAADLAAVRKSLEEKAQAELHAKIDALHGKIDALSASIKSHVEAEVGGAIDHLHAVEDRLASHLNGPRAVIAALVVGAALGAGAMFGVTHGF